jgi:hypothetical protein
LIERDALDEDINGAGAQVVWRHRRDFGDGYGYSGHIVGVVALGQDFLRVDMQLEDIIAGGHPGDVYVLAIKGAEVNIAPAGLDTLVCAVEKGSG